MRCRERMRRIHPTKRTKTIWGHSTVRATQICAKMHRNSAIAIPLRSTNTHIFHQSSMKMVEVVLSFRFCSHIGCDLLLRMNEQTLASQGGRINILSGQIVVSFLFCFYFSRFEPHFVYYFTKILLNIFLQSSISFRCDRQTHRNWFFIRTFKVTTIQLLYWTWLVSKRFASLA